MSVEMKQQMLSDIEATEASLERAEDAERESYELYNRRQKTTQDLAVKFYRLKSQYLRLFGE